MSILQTSADKKPAVGGDGGQSEPAAAGNSSLGDTAYPAEHSLPDLARLTLGDHNGGRVDEQPGGQGRLPPRVAPGSTVHITVNAHAQGAPVTINVLPTFAAPAIHAGDGDRTTRRIPSPRTALPTPSRSRIRLGPAQNVAAAPAATAAPLPTVGANPGVAAQPAVTTEPAVPAALGAHGPAAAPPQVHAAQPAGTVEANDPTPPPPSPTLQSVPGSPASSTHSLVWEDAYEYIAPADPTHNRWYVVTAGRRVGIWRQWTDMQAYVTRIPGNAHKLFSTRADAEAHYYSAKAAGDVEVILPCSVPLCLVTTATVSLR